MSNKFDKGVNYGKIMKKVLEKSIRKKFLKHCFKNLTLRNLWGKLIYGIILP